MPYAENINCVHIHAHTRVEHLTVYKACLRSLSHWKDRDPGGLREVSWEVSGKGLFSVQGPLSCPQAPLKPKSQETLISTTHNEEADLPGKKKSFPL